MSTISNDTEGIKLCKGSRFQPGGSWFDKSVDCGRTESCKWWNKHYLYLVVSKFYVCVAEVFGTVKCNIPAEDWNIKGVRGDSFLWTVLLGMFLLYVHGLLSILWSSLAITAFNVTAVMWKENLSVWWYHWSDDVAVYPLEKAAASWVAHDTRLPNSGLSQYGVWSRSDRHAKRESEENLVRKVFHQKQRNKNRYPAFNDKTNL